MRRLLEADDVAGLRDLFHTFYAGIPHRWCANNDIADYEGFYASVFYSYFAGLGLDVTVEESTNRGRLDMAVRFEGRVYVFESGYGVALIVFRVAHVTVATRLPSGSRFLDGFGRADR